MTVLLNRAYFHTKCNLCNGKIFAVINGVRALCPRAKIQIDKIAMAAGVQKGTMYDYEICSPWKHKVVHHGPKNIEPVQ